MTLLRKKVENKGAFNIYFFPLALHWSIGPAIHPLTHPSNHPSIHIQWFIHPEILTILSIIWYLLFIPPSIQPLSHPSHDPSTRNPSILHPGKRHSFGFACFGPSGSSRAPGWWFHGWVSVGGDQREPPGARHVLLTCRTCVSPAWELLGSGALDSHKPWSAWGLDLSDLIKLNLSDLLGSESLLTQINLVTQWSTRNWGKFNLNYNGESCSSKSPNLSIKVQSLLMNSCIHFWVSGLKTTNTSISQNCGYFCQCFVHHICLWCLWKGSTLTWRMLHQRRK